MLLAFLSFMSLEFLYIYWGWHCSAQKSWRAVLVFLRLNSCYSLVVDMTTQQSRDDYAVFVKLVMDRCDLPGDGTVLGTVNGEFILGVWRAIHEEAVNPQHNLDNILKDLTTKLPLESYLHKQRTTLSSPAISYVNPDFPCHGALHFSNLPNYCQEENFDQSDDFLESLWGLCFFISAHVRVQLRQIPLCSLYDQHFSNLFELADIEIDLGDTSRVIVTPVFEFVRFGAVRFDMSKCMIPYLSTVIRPMCGRGTLWCEAFKCNLLWWRVEQNP